MSDFQVISIVGPTASGKTSLALRLAEDVVGSGRAGGAAIISADSRQVYRGLETLSGADVPLGFKAASDPELNYNFYRQNEISLHGVSIISPDEDWSVAHFQELALQVAKWAASQGKLVVVVGGTGLYHRHLFNSDPQLKVPPDEQVRTRAAQMSLQELQSWAEQADPEKFAAMNDSDRQNPRRLIRVIEIGQAQAAAQTAVQTENSQAGNLQEELFVVQPIFTIGLKVPKADLQDRIGKRVKSRLADGARSEVETIFGRYQDQGKIPAFSTLGFKEILSFIQGEIDQEALVKVWTRRELAYSKRQMTWFNKYGQVNWFAYDSPNLSSKVLDILPNSKPNSKIS